MQCQCSATHNAGFKKPECLSSASLRHQKPLHAVPCCISSIAVVMLLQFVCFQASACDAQCTDVCIIFTASFSANWICPAVSDCRRGCPEPRACSHRLHASCYRAICQLQLPLHGSVHGIVHYLAWPKLLPLGQASAQQLLQSIPLGLPGACIVGKVAPALLDVQIRLGHQAVQHLGRHPWHLCRIRVFQAERKDTRCFPVSVVS